MECEFNNPLSDEQLLAVADGETDPPTLNHLQRCQYCRQRLHELEEFEQHLLNRFHPDLQQLLDFSFDLLSEPEITSILDHVKQCADCREIVAEFEQQKQDSVREIDNLASVWKTTHTKGVWREFVAQPVAQTDAGIAVLGSSESAFVADAGGTQLFIQLQADGNLFNLDGQVVASDQTSWEGAVAALTPIEDTEAAPLTTLVDDLGQFRYQKIAPGKYKLRIVSLMETAITLYDINLTG